MARETEEGRKEIEMARGGGRENREMIEEGERGEQRGRWEGDVEGERRQGRSQSRVQRGESGEGKLDDNDDRALL
jgi:hypothetical protein